MYKINVISDDVQMRLYIYDPIGGLVELEADAVNNRMPLDADETVYIEIYQPDNQKSKYLLSVKPNEANKFYELTLDGDKYYTDYNNSGHLYKTDMTSGASNLMQAYLSKWTVTDEGYLYFVVRNGNSPGIYKMDYLDTTDISKISNDNAFYLTISGNFLYYSNWNDGGKIYRIHTSGLRKLKVCDDEASNLEVVGDYIYYDNGHQGGERYKVNKIPANVDQPVHGTPVN